jgi:hypothetical protein
MRNARWFVCFLVTAALGFAGAVGAQQQALDSAPPAASLQQPAQDAQQPGQFSELPPNPVNPAAPQANDRSLLQNSQAPANQPAPGQSEQSPTPPRAELGVWLGAIDGPGLRIRRITEGSAAQQAGLRPGDVLMQINDNWASSPQQAAETIRAIPIGESVKLQIWRDGQVQEISATMAAVQQPVVAMNNMNRRQPYEVGFRNNESSSSGDLSQRIVQLERQLGTLTQELQQLRRQFSQMQPGGATNRGEIQTTSGVESPAVNATQPEPTPPASTVEPAAPPVLPGIDQPAEEIKQPDSDQPPATDKQSDDDSLFK